MSQGNEAGAAAVRAWGNPRVFNREQCEVINGWAEQLLAGGADVELSPKWPSRRRATQASREETARRLFREAAEGKVTG